MIIKSLTRYVLPCALSALTVLVLLPLALLAQNAPVMPPGTIDGAKNPELIPDVVAYRLFFVAVATPPGPTADQQRRQTAKLARIGLTQADSQILISTLTTFYTQYPDFIKRENAAADQARAAGLPIDVKASGARRDALVQSTLAGLKSALTPTGVEALEAHVQQEKAGIKIVPMKAQ